MAHLIIKISDELRTRFKSRCIVDSTTMTDKIRFWIQDYVEQPIQDKSPI